jgi:hypothetical protein
MNEDLARPLGRRKMLLGCAIFFAIGVAAMIFLQGSGLTSPSKYHRDLTQSPHWVAYHGERFAADDLLVEYATFNESPVQNAIYWVGTWLFDVVLLNKLVGITIFGLTAALFFGLVSSMSGPQVGALAAFFFVVFPRSAYEIAGGFSKAWAIGLVLVAVYVVETRRWQILPWVMPLAALAYPVAAVLIGAIVSVGLLLELPRSVGEGIRGLKRLALGSALAVVPLLYKYLTPPGRIGEMISTREMRELWELGINTTVTVPLWEDLLYYIEQPFFIYGAVLVSMLSLRRGLVWKRSWTALAIASTVGYYVADLVVPRLYLPDRYSRFSMAVLLVLWFAYNWARSLAIFERRWIRATAYVVLAGFALVSFSDTFRPCDGSRYLGIWQDGEQYEELSGVLAEQPSPVLVAGHPYATAEVMLQARQPALVIHRMFHPWFRGYSREIDQRIRDTFRVVYARDVAKVNQFALQYGVTHLIVRKADFSPSRRRSGRIYRPQYEELVARIAQGPEDFVLKEPPADAVLYEDRRYWLVRVPLEEPVPLDAP